MNTNRMAACLCAFFCVLAGGFFTAPEIASAASQKTTKIEKRIDTGAQLVTKENLDDPKVKEVMQPDLKKWLNE